MKIRLSVENIQQVKWYIVKLSQFEKILDKNAYLQSFN